jgi:hypothetical protein
MRILVSCATTLGLAAMLSLGVDARAQSSEAANVPEVTAVPACSFADARPGNMRCNAWIVSDDAGQPKVFETPSGFHPADLRAAYNIKKVGSKDTIVAIVDAYHYVTAEQDLNIYRKEFGIPPCTHKNGCFKRVNQHGHTQKWPVTNVSWNQEAALDLDMVSAMCPKCRIIFVEADNNHSPNLGKATAARKNGRRTRSTTTTIRASRSPPAAATAAWAWASRPVRRT